MTGTVIIGREQEVAVLRAFVERADDGPGALLLEGDAGAGKTTLWEAALEQARTLELDVRAARPLEAEARLAFAVLGDLLVGVDEILDELPEPQAHALRVALLLEQAGEEPADERAVGVALVAALRHLSAERPQLVAIDDIQWLDGPTASVLAFAMRRLETERVRLLLALRREQRTRLPFDPDRVLPSFERLRVTPLDLDATHRLLLDRIGTAFSRPIVRSLHEVSGGNPFFVLELARALAPRLESYVPGSALPVPTSLQELVGERIEALPAETRDALAAVAALAQPVPELVAAAVGRSAESLLAPAFAAGVIEPLDDRLRFAHPLLAAAASQACPPARLRVLHRAIADAVTDPEERAHHLALASAEPSAEVAAEIEAAARRARARGAPVVAAELAQHAVRLTPAGDVADARRRTADAAFWTFEAGDTRRARTLLEDVLTGAEHGAERTRLLLRLARIRSYDDDIRAARGLFLAAVDEAGDEHELRLDAHVGVAATSFRLREQLPEAVAHASAAAELAERLGRNDLLAEALADRGLSEAALGRTSAVGTLRAAMRLEPETRSLRILASPAFQDGVVAFWHDDLDGALATFLQLKERASAMDDESSLPYVLVMLGQIECVRGRPDDALSCTNDGLDHARQAGQETIVAYLLAVAAWAHAHAGDEPEARGAAEEALQLAERTSGVPARFFATAALGLLELTLGDARAAHDRLAPLVAFVREQGIDEPGTTRFVADDVEALVELGLLDEATELLDWYEGNANRLKRRSAQALALRCRGQLAAAASDLGRAVGALERAVELHSVPRIPVDEARTLLALGAAQRRGKERRSARLTLERALAGFEETCARLWAARASAELARIGGRAAAGGELTPVERRVAELVASGRTNREVAAALFLSVRTVEGHLSRVYAKLGVRSRVELARSFERG